jgi:hypothetical protein
MVRMGPRIGIRAGVGMAVAALVLAVPGIASATVNQGTFSTGLGTDGSMATTILYQSKSTASTCVDVTSLRGAWHFILIWRNGGLTPIYTPAGALPQAVSTAVRRSPFPVTRRKY